MWELGLRGSYNPTAAEFQSCTHTPWEVRMAIYVAWYWPPRTMDTSRRIAESLRIMGTLETQSPSIRILRLDGLVYAAILQMARMSPWVQKRFAQHLVAPSSRTGLTPYLLIPTQGSYLPVRDKTPWLQTQQVGQMEGGRTKVGGRRKMHVPEGKIFSFEAQQNHRVVCHEAPLFFPASSSAALCIPFSPPTSAHSTTKLLLPL